MSERPKPYDKPILSVDFDGVIHSYKSGWQGATIIPDPPVPGVFEWMEAALAYFEIHVYSSRSSEVGGREAMQAYIMAHSGRDSTLSTRVNYPDSKPHAFLSIDDRAMRFDGDWSAPQFNPKTLRNFQPWYKRARHDNP